MKIIKKYDERNTALKLIRKIGNLRFMYEQNGPHDITVYAINGGDIVASEVYFNRTPADAMKSMLRNRFDTFHEYEINGATLDNIKVEYDGNLISGQLHGCTDTEYFKRIDDTPYYKHFTHRPM